MSLAHSTNVNRLFLPVTTVMGPWMLFNVCRVYLKEKSFIFEGKKDQDNKDKKLVKRDEKGEEEKKREEREGKYMKV